MISEGNADEVIGATHGCGCAQEVPMKKMDLKKHTGKHVEIYLSDIRKADPAKWKTILRQPMR